MNKRRTPYRKNVEKDVLEALPEPTESQQIVQVVQSHGSNIFEVAFPPTAPSTNTEEEAEATTVKTTLARLPTRFRKLIWVKRGTYLLCSSSDTDYQTAKGEKGRVTMNVDYVLFERQVKHLQKNNMWPEGWASAFNGKTEYSREDMLRKETTEEGGIGEKEMEQDKETKGNGETKGNDGNTNENKANDKNDDDEEEEDNDLFVNRNRMRNQDDSDTDLSSDEDD